LIFENQRYNKSNIKIDNNLFKLQNLNEKEKQFIDSVFGKNLGLTEINEGLWGEIVGGLTGFALGQKVGEIIAKALGVEKGILYDLLTSRLFGAAIGAAIGK